MENLEMSFLILGGGGGRGHGWATKSTLSSPFLKKKKKYIDSWGGVIQILNVSVENSRNTSWVTWLLAHHRCF